MTSPSVFSVQIPSGDTPEWGFVGSPFWGPGFSYKAEAVLDFAFHGIGLEELCACAPPSTTAAGTQPSRK